MDKPIPRWVTSWPDWYGIVGNVEVVPAIDHDLCLQKIKFLASFLIGYAGQGGKDLPDVLEKALEIQKLCTTDEGKAT